MIEKQSGGRTGAPEPSTAKRPGATDRRKIQRGLRFLGSFRFARFLVVGGIGYLVNQLVLFLLYDTPVLPGLPDQGTAWRTALFNVRDVRLLISSIVAVEMSIISNFSWHHFWTFSHRSMDRLHLRFLRFNLTSVGSPLISLAMINTLTPFLGINYLIANSLGIALGLIWNWLWASKVIWKHAPRAGSPRS